jgi:PIN domain nuclease of toxin-antitoxin system
MPPDSVLDASAALAFLRKEPGGDIVERHLGQAAMSSVNVAEVCDHYVKVGAARGEVRAIVLDLSILIVEADVELAIDASLLMRTTRAAGLSLGDRFCLALAKRLELPALTADRAWARIADAIGVRVELIR